MKTKKNISKDHVHSCSCTVCTAANSARCPSCGGYGQNPDGSTCKRCCETGTVDD